MLTNSHFEQIRTTRGVIAHVTDEGSTRIPLNTILAILDFILLGLKEIFFDKMGKPKSKLQLILSIPSIIKFAVEVINRVTKDIHRPARVKGISNEQKVVDAIDKAARRVSLKEGGIAHGPTFGGQPDSAEFIAPISDLKKHFPEIDKAVKRNKYA